MKNSTARKLQQIPEGDLRVGVDPQETNEAEATGNRGLKDQSKLSMSLRPGMCDCFRYRAKSKNHDNQTYICQDNPSMRHILSDR